MIPLAKYLGVKEIVPAYLDQKLQQNEAQQSGLLTGVSFASGGAGFIPETSEAGVKIESILYIILAFATLIIINVLII